MKIIYELSWLWETLGIALMAAVIVVIGAAAFVGAVLAVILIARTPMPL